MADSGWDQLKIDLTSQMTLQAGSTVHVVCVFPADRELMQARAADILRVGGGSSNLVPGFVIPNWRSIL